MRRAILRILEALVGVAGLTGGVTGLVVILSAPTPLDMAARAVTAMVLLAVGSGFLTVAATRRGR
ncbi:hypothetical protein ACLUWO_05000 [Pseudoscardovia radai]|uniref:hypothetical protein n=1 Tax=Pseudoscardovia radai TaxID=987066 RepID=UPI00399449A3